MKTLNIILTLNLLLSVGLSAGTLPPQQGGLDKSITGVWEHTQAVADMMKAEGLAENCDLARKTVLRYDFRADGTFIKTLYCSETAFILSDEGKWAISADGQYVVLYRREGDSAYTELIKIKHLDGDELVIEQTLAFHRAAAGSERRDLFFNKI